MKQHSIQVTIMLIKIEYSPKTLTMNRIWISGERWSVSPVKLMSCLF